MPPGATKKQHSLTRRKFLKSAVLTSSTLALGIGAQNPLSPSVPASATQVENCKFSSLSKDFIYLNSGTEGSMPDCVLDSFQQNLLKWAANPTTSYELDLELGKQQELNRERVAAFLGVGKNNICLTDNTTMGLSMAIMGLNFQQGDTVIATNHEHSATISPLRVRQERLGLNVIRRAFPRPEKLSRMSVADLLDFLFPNIESLRGARALCVSHVYPTTGTRLPLLALREKVNELNIEYLIVDGAQALGMLDVGTQGDSITNTDFYACPGHKWLNGPPSTGVLYLQNSEIRPPEFMPTGSQRMGKYDDCSEDSPSCFPMASALQLRGCSNTPGFTAMVEAMDFAQVHGGPVEVERHILGLSAQVRGFIASKAPNCIISPYADSELASGLTAFFPFDWNKPHTPYMDKKTADLVVQKLLEHNIQVRSIGFRNPDTSSNTAKAVYALRVSTGFFNTSEQVDSFKDALGEVLSELG